MLIKSVSAAIGVMMLPVLFSVIGGQDSDSAAGQSAKTQKEVTRWSSLERTDSPVQRFFGLTSQARGLEQSINETAKELRQAKSADDQAAAKGKLVKLLGEDYDARLADYEKYLDELEKRLEGMRAKLAKRRDAKEKMIDLRIEVLKAEADDLGWPSRMNRGFGSRFPAGLGSSTRSSNLLAREYEALPKSVKPAAIPASPRSR